MKAKGRQLGINFEFDTMVGNSLDSLRLLVWAETLGIEGKQEELAEVLGAGHFEQKKSVGDHAALLEACESAGLERAEAKKILETGAFKSEVLERIRAVQASGVHSIPVVTIDNRFTLQGACSVEEYARILMQLDAEAATS
mmetsp:Transcript_52595/g.123025  ORF Transcript_52595/g.123025 Transcript_52595/m.123025 type:complete len:141 (-) Transcript_52595:120-542(-)